MSFPCPFVALFFSSFPLVRSCPNNLVVFHPCGTQLWLIQQKCFSNVYYCCQLHNINYSCLVCQRFLYPTTHDHIGRAILCRHHVNSLQSWQNYLLVMIWILFYFIYILSSYFLHVCVNCSSVFLPSHSILSPSQVCFFSLFVSLHIVCLCLSWVSSALYWLRVIYLFMSCKIAATSIISL